MVRPLSLTAAAIDSIEPGRTRIEQSFVDETGQRIKGLRLFVSPSGGKVFYYAFRAGTKNKVVRIEEYKRQHFEGAQRPRLYERLHALTLERDGGETPSSRYREMQRKLKNQEQAERMPAHRPTVKTIVDAYLRTISTIKSPRFKKSWREDTRLLTKDILPRLGKRIAEEVGRDDFKRVLETVADRSPVTGNRTQAALSTCLNWAMNERLIPFNPITGLKKVGGQERYRERVLTETEIKAFWQGVDAFYRPTYRIRSRERTDDPIRVMTKENALAKKILLLTGCRRSEVSQAEWAEVDWKQKLWEIPSRRTKTASVFVVPLPDYVVELLEQLHQITGETPYWLPGKRLKSKGFEYTGKPTTITTLSHALIDARNRGAFGDTEAFTVHDLRRTLRTRIIPLGVDRDTAERLMNHAVGNRVVRTYDRYEYMPEKRRALTTWSSYVIDLVKSNEGSPDAMDAQ